MFSPSLAPLLVSSTWLKETSGVKPRHSLQVNGTGQISGAGVESYITPQFKWLKGIFAPVNRASDLLLVVMVHCPVIETDNPLVAEGHSKLIIGAKFATSSPFLVQEVAWTLKHWGPSSCSAPYGRWVSNDGVPPGRPAPAPGAPRLFSAPPLPSLAMTFRAAMLPSSLATFSPFFPKHRESFVGQAGDFLRRRPGRRRT